MIIYKAENIITGEVYIGKTIAKLSSRISKHKYEALKRKGNYRNSKFYTAIRDFGVNCFKFSEIGNSNTHKNLKLLERRMIIKYNSIDDGYNSQIR
jgi:hypothetical protein